MARNMLIFGLWLLAAVPANGAVDEAAADRITLRDGTVVLGLVNLGDDRAARGGRVPGASGLGRAERQGPSGGVGSRDRPDCAARGRAASDRGWRAGVASGSSRRASAPDDRILRWIDGEQKRLADPEAAARTALVPVRLPRSEVRQLDRQPAAASRVLRLAWTGGVREPESMGLAELTDAVESRGFVVDPKAAAQPVSLDRLLPPAPETEAVWLARRAATEIAIDDGLRFLRYQDTVLPDMGPGQQAPSLNPAMVVSEIKRLLDPDGGQNRPDPLAEKLQAVAGRGRIGAVVTRLDDRPRPRRRHGRDDVLGPRSQGGQWVAYGSRASTVRADDLKPDEGGDLAEDPQVKAAFGMVEALGLGCDPARAQAAEPPHRGRDPEGPRRRPIGLQPGPRRPDAARPRARRRSRRARPRGREPDAPGNPPPPRSQARPAPFHARPAGSLSPDSPDPGGTGTARSAPAAG